VDRCGRDVEKKADSHGRRLGGNKSIQPQAWWRRVRAVLDTNQESIKKNKRDSQMDQFQVKFRFLLSVGSESSPVAFMSKKNALDSIVSTRVSGQRRATDALSESAGSPTSSYSRGRLLVDFFEPLSSSSD
jgi:hypothetical protein